MAATTIWFRQLCETYLATDTTKARFALRVIQGTR